MALDGAGRVLARSDTFAPAAGAGHPAVVDDARPRPAAPPSARYRSKAAPTSAPCCRPRSERHRLRIRARRHPVDDGLARTLKDVSDREIVILSPQGVAASTLPTDNLPWKSASDVEAHVRRQRAARRDLLGGEHFQAVLAPVAVRHPAADTEPAVPRPRAGAVSQHPAGPARAGIVAAGAGIAGSAVLARSLTAPIARLVDATREVAAGNLRCAARGRLEATRSDTWRDRSST